MSRKVFIGPKTKASINTGGIDVGTSAVQVSTSGRALEGGVQVVATSTNTGIVYVGSRANITAGTVNATDGFPLSAGESVFLPASSESQVWMISDVSAQRAHFLSF